MTKESLRRDVPSSPSTIKLPRNIILQKPKPFIMAPTYQFFPTTPKNGESSPTPKKDSLV